MMGNGLVFLTQNLLVLILELGTLDPMLCVIISGNQEGIIIRQQDRPRIVNIEERLFRFLLTDILGNLQSYAPLGTPDTDGDLLGISFPSLTVTSLAIVDGELLCIELGDVFYNIASEGAFEGISEGDTEPLPPN